MTPEFHREIGIPRTAAVEHPYGRTVGQVGDHGGQKKVLLESLAVLESTTSPGQRVDLPFTWPEDPRETDWHPPEISPYIKLFLDEIKKTRAEARGQ